LSRLDGRFEKIAGKSVALARYKAGVVHPARVLNL
jgi:hypothetical protein